MKHHSLYLEWYISVPKVKYDFRSSGLNYFKCNLGLSEIDLSTNYAHGNPETTKLLAKRYNVNSENIFVSSEGASGQNMRIIRFLAEKNKKKNEAVVEYPTYEPLLRQVQEHFPTVKRLERKEEESYRLDADELRKIVSEKTALLVLTNPHAPSGAVADANELNEIMAVAREFDCCVLCDEIYAEFDRKAIPTTFSIDKKLGITTTSFTKAYGLGGLRLGIALGNRELVNELYTDVLGSVGNTSNIVQFIAAELLKKHSEKLEKHKSKWAALKSETEKWLEEKNLEYFPNKAGVTYWVKTPIRDTYKWTNEHTIPHYSLVTVPGAFFLFRNDEQLTKSNYIRLGLGNINPEEPNLTEAFTLLEEALNLNSK